MKNNPNSDIEKVVEEIIKEAFRSGHDQGIHEVKEPDVDSFYRNCWEDRVEKPLLSIREKTLRDTAKWIGELTAKDIVADIDDKDISEKVAFIHGIHAGLDRVRAELAQDHYLKEHGDI